MKQILISIGIVVVAVALIELGSLLFLSTSVKRNLSFWHTKATQPGEITYLALGDSAAQGIGASSPMKGYVGLVAKDLEKQTGKTVKVINLSKTGATIQDAITEQLPKVPTITADIVTVEIGANDIKTFEPVTFERDFRRFIAGIPNGTYVSNMPYFGSRSESRPKAMEATKIIDRVLSEHPQLRRVDLQSQTQATDSILGYAADYFHPNNRAYRRWSTTFLSEIHKHPLN